MLKLNTENLEKTGHKHETSGDYIPTLLEQIHKRKQGFYKIIDDDSVVDSINQFAQESEGKYDDIIVLGIGGSSLGTICLQQSLTHLYQNELKDSKFPKLHVIDNIDPILIKEIQDVIDYKRTLFIVVTKSGGTPETLSQYFYFRRKCEEKGLLAKQHFVFITDPERGLLRKISNEEGIPAFDVPPDVGGRFSVLTPVGLLPAKLIGIDIKGLLTGARNMRDKFLSEELDQNFPFQLASIQHALAESGMIMNVLMPYSQKLIRFADWYRQLLAESIGKRLNDKGEEVFTGITPINALGATDQHSQNQLYNEGPNDKLLIFIKVQDMAPEIPIPNLNPDDPIVDFLQDITFNKLIHTEMQGTIQSLNENNRPSLTITIDKVSPETLGELFMLFEGATAFLGEFYGINAFDQPGVELSKNLTKELLIQKRTN